MSLADYGVVAAYLLLVIEGRRTIAAVAAIIATPAVIYVLFVNLLGIALPVGLLKLGILGI